MPRALTGPFAPSRDWDALKRAYEATEGELGALATDNGITLKTLQSYARKRSWARRAEPRHRPPNTSAGLPAKVRLRPKSGGADLAIYAACRELVLRLYKIITLKVEQLEASMQSNEERTPADHERETRVIAALIRNVDQVHEYCRSSEGEAAVVRNTAPKSGQSGTSDNDAEHLRREVAARIQRLRERHLG